jgi:hypothetical protein
MRLGSVTSGFQSIRLLTESVMPAYNGFEPSEVWLDELCRIGNGQLRQDDPVLRLPGLPSVKRMGPAERVVKTLRFRLGPHTGATR